MAFDVRIRFQDIMRLREELRGAGRDAEDTARKLGSVDISRSTIGERSLSGPSSRLATARANYEVLRRSQGTNREDLFDARLAVQRAARAYSRAEQEMEGGPSINQRVMNVLKSSRFGAGGIMPLVGQTASVLGPEGAAIGAAVAGLASVFREATQRVGEFRGAAVVSGGRSSDIAGAGAFGVRPGEVAGAAAGLQQRLASDPRAMLMAARLGIEAQPDRMFAPANQAKLLNRTLTELRKVTDAEEQLRIARELGLEGMLDEIRVSDRVFRARQADARLQEMIYSEPALAQFRDMASQVNRAESALGNLGTTVSKAFVPSVDRAAGGLADAVNLGARAAEWASPLFQGMQQMGARAAGLGPIMDILGLFHLGGGGGQDDHTEAIRENTRMLREGMAGGGPRASAGMASDLRGQLGHEAFQRDRVNLGAFG